MSVPPNGGLRIEIRPHIFLPYHFQILLTNQTFSVTDSITELKKKVKCTLVQALRLCTGRMAHRGSRGIALPFLDHGTRRGWGVSVTPRALFTPGKDPVSIV